MNGPLPPAVVRGRRVVVALLALSALIAAGCVVIIVAVALRLTGLLA
jgi:hypothetical protein